MPSRYISPLGAGRPPAGSRVTAKAFTAATPGRGRTARLPVPAASTVKTPAETGALLPIQSVEVRRGKVGIREDSAAECGSGNGGIAPLELTENFIHIGAEIGVLLLLFMLGLEYSGDELKANLHVGLPAGLLICFSTSRQAS